VWLVELTDLERLRSPAAAAALYEEVSVLTAPEPLVLRLSSRDSPVDAAAEVLRAAPTVTVIVGQPGAIAPALLDAADVCLTTADDPPGPWVTDDVDAIAAAVAAQPAAALALVALLRASERQPTWAAVSAESASYALLLGSNAFRQWLAARGPAVPKSHERPPVAVDRRGALLEVVLDRPEARNAVDADVRDGLVAAFHLAASDPTIEQLRLSGRGPCFSAGGDLAEFGTVADPAIAHAVRLTRHPGLALAAVAGKSSARLHGTCIGAGIEIPAFAGHVAAESATTFRLPELAMGLIPGAGGTVSIRRRIGRQRTAWLALTGAVLDAATARTWGLIDEVLPRAAWT
jgi:enoyl-CoA hydratase/carnithine racemase